MKQRIVLAALFSTAVSCSMASAAVILTSTAPTNTTSTYTSYPSTSPLLLTSANDYFAFGVITRGTTPIAGDRPTGSNFGSLSVVEVYNTPSPTTVNNYGFRGSGGGLGAFYKGSTTAYSGFAQSQSENYNGTTMTDGSRLTYTLAANTKATLNFYVAGFAAQNAGIPFGYSLLSDTSATALASITTPTSMTIGESNSTNGDRSTGLLSFAIQNTNLTASVLTFTLYTGGGNGLGIAAATATTSPVPEPASIAMLGALGSLGLLSRRRAKCAG